MSKNRMSVLISFLNEGDELARTLQSVRDTAGDNVDIIVLNDNSNDGVDYERMVAPYNVEYHKSSVRLGSSAGKAFCVNKCKTPFFVLLDAHCRFHTPDWLEKALDVMSAPNSDKTVFCFACHYFSDANGYESQKHMKAYGGYFDYNIKTVFSPAWNVRRLAEDPFDIPCILGANYLCSKKWWEQIGGFQGLRLYGREEPFICIKSKMAGGFVKCIPTIVTGHKARPNRKPPYTLFSYENVHNEMVIAYICLPEKFDRLMKIWKRIHNPQVLESARRFFASHATEMMKLRLEFQSIKKLEYSELDEFNRDFQAIIGFSYQKLKSKNKAH